MKRRIVSALAIAALLVAGIAGAIGSSVTPTLARGQPMDEPQFDLAPSSGESLATVTLALEIISGNDRAVASTSSNQVLAGFLRDIPGYMERVGSGVRFMIQEMRELGLPDPEFSEHFDFMVVFRNGLASANQAVDLNERQQIALRIIREKGSLSTGEYSAATGASERTALRELREMLDRGIIVSRGKTRGLRYFLP